MSDQVQAWLRLASDLKLDVSAPCEITLTDGTHIIATALVRNFGAAKGMVIHDDHTVLWPHRDVLVAEGYSWSIVCLVDQDSPLAEQNRIWEIDMLADWGWASSAPPPLWLPKVQR